MACKKVCVAGLSIKSQRLAEALFFGLSSPHPSLLTEFKAQGVQGPGKEFVSAAGSGLADERAHEQNAEPCFGESQTLHRGLAVAHDASIICASVRRRKFLGNRLHSSSAPGAVCRPP